MSLKNHISLVKAFHDEFLEFLEKSKRTGLGTNGNASTV